jgi:hypothetical protein
MTGLLFSVIATGACAPRGYQVYDVQYRDYHRWNAHETVLYGRWEGETHRDHKEFQQRPSDDQQQYWSWRHGHRD